MHNGIISGEFCLNSQLSYLLGKMLNGENQT